MCGALGEAQDLKKVPVLEMPFLGLHKAQAANGKDKARDRGKGETKEKAVLWGEDQNGHSISPSR